MDMRGSSVAGFDSGPADASAAAQTARLRGKDRLARRIRNPAFDGGQVAARAQRGGAGIDMRSCASLEELCRQVQQVPVCRHCRGTGRTVIGAGPGLRASAKPAGGRFAPQRLAGCR